MKILKLKVQRLYYKNFKYNYLNIYQHEKTKKIIIRSHVND